jgi:hypothetical protein
VYREFVDCIDQRLTELEKNLGTSNSQGRPFRAWFPTFPDVTVELSRRHPDWEYTRTNDFWSRIHLAVEHGHEVEAVIVTETLGWADRTISAPLSEHPEIESIWMTWNQHYLHQLNSDPAWKPRNRYLCQRGRWQAFLYMKDEKTKR